ncbi:MAG: trypsin-like peptidase domain-containing protein, partial [Planctomycetota bacterium]
MLRRSIALASVLATGVLIGWGFHSRFDTPSAHASPQSPLVTPAAPVPQGQYANPQPPPNPAGIQLADGFVASSPEEAIHVSLYEAVNRGVVNISTRTIRPEAFLLVAEIEGNGSGSVIDRQGHILTNFHVIEGARNINVTLFNGESFSAELVGQD